MVHETLETPRDDLFELNDIGGEFSDAIGKLVGGHGVFVKHPAKRFFIHGNFFDVGRCSRSCIELAADGICGHLQFLEEDRADG